MRDALPVQVVPSSKSRSTGGQCCLFGQSLDAKLGSGRVDQVLRHSAFLGLVVVDGHGRLARDATRRSRSWAEFEISMDLSHQELPLTAYFPKSNSQKRKNGAAERSSKRAKAQTPSVPARRAKPQVHLHTPATSTRRHAKRADIQSVEDASPKPRKPCEIDLTVSDSDEPPAASPFHSLPTPSSTNESTRNGVSNLSNQLPRTSHTGLFTPSTTARKLPAPGPTRFFQDPSPTAVHSRSSKSNIASAVPLKFSHTKHSVQSDKSVSKDHTTAGNSDSSKPRDNDNPFAIPVIKPLPVIHTNRCQRAPVEPTATESNLGVLEADGDTHTSFQTVPSSQSQYLLPPDATPTRNRINRYDDIVPGSQTQEEGEIFMGMPPYSFHKGSVRESGGGHLSTMQVDPQSLRHSPNTAYRLTPSKAQTPQTQKTSPNRSKLNVDPTKTPTRYKRASQRTHALSPSSHTLSRKDSMDVPPVLGDESLTEPESETEIQECLAAIKQRRTERAHIPSPSRVEVSRPLISPLVSPMRRRYTPELSISASLEALMQDGAGMSIPGTCTSSNFERKCLGRRGSFPSAVRDFMDMFTGDGSYPDDFPESLRI